MHVVHSVGYRILLVLGRHTLFQVQLQNFLECQLAFCWLCLLCSSVVSFFRLFGSTTWIPKKLKFTLRFGSWRPFYFLGEVIKHFIYLTWKKKGDIFHIKKIGSWLESIANKQYYGMSMSWSRIVCFLGKPKEDISRGGGGGVCECKDIYFWTVLDSHLFCQFDFKRINLSASFYQLKFFQTPHLHASTYSK